MGDAERRPAEAAIVAEDARTSAERSPIAKRTIAPPAKSSGAVQRSDARAFQRVLASSQSATTDGIVATIARSSSTTLGFLPIPVE